MATVVRCLASSYLFFGEKGKKKWRQEEPIGDWPITTMTSNVLYRVDALLLFSFVAVEPKTRKELRRSSFFFSSSLFFFVFIVFPFFLLLYLVLPSFFFIQISQCWAVGFVCGGTIDPICFFFSYYLIVYLVVTQFYLVLPSFSSFFQC